MNSYSHNFAVCIGRQLGSGGRNVALAISRKMGIAFYDKEIINQAAKDSGLDPEYFEKVDEKPTIPILGGLAGVHIPFFSGGYLDTESYLGNNNLFKIQSRTVEMLADKGSPRRRPRPGSRSATASVPSTTTTSPSRSGETLLHTTCV